MRFAALYDIHGNLPALEAVLRDIRQANVDQIVVGGDVVPGPLPCEALRRLLDLDLPSHFIHGNGELAILAQMAGARTGSVTYWGTTLGARPQKVSSRSIAGLPHSCNRTWSRCSRTGLKRSSLRLTAWARCCSAIARRAAKQRSSLVSRLKIASYQSFKDSTHLWSSAVIPTCSSEEPEW